MFIFPAFNFWPIILGACFGAGKWQKKATIIKNDDVIEGCCRAALKGQHTGFLGADLQPLAGWPVSGRVVAPNLNEVVGVWQHIVQSGMVPPAGHHHPLCCSLIVLVSPPILHLETYKDKKMRKAAHMKKRLQRQHRVLFLALILHRWVFFYWPGTHLSCSAGEEATKRWPQWRRELCRQF